MAQRRTIAAANQHWRDNLSEKWRNAYNSQDTGISTTVQDLSWFRGSSRSTSSKKKRKEKEKDEDNKPEDDKSEDDESEDKDKNESKDEVIISFDTLRSHNNQQS